MRACTGAVLSLLDTPERDRDMSLAADAREAVVAAITTQDDSTAASGPVRAAISLGACVDQAIVMTPNERHLLKDWLNRVADGSA